MCCPQRLFFALLGTPDAQAILGTAHSKLAALRVALGESTDSATDSSRLDVGSDQERLTNFHLREGVLRAMTTSGTLGDSNAIFNLKSHFECSGG